MEFEWDVDKAGTNQTKHGVSFHEAASVFNDPFALTYSDPDHSVEEDRSITIGMCSPNRLLIVAHTDRKGRLRIISARETTRRERKLYEEDES